MRANRALIADDHVIVRAGLKTILREISAYMQVDEAVNGDQVFSFVKKNDYDILILDVNMPDTDAIALVSNVIAYRGKIKILIFSMNSETLYAKRFLKLGVLGYLDKESDADEIRRAINSVLNGTVYLSERLKRFFVEDLSTERKQNPFEQLSNREIQIAKYLLQGYSLMDIKKALNLHSSTIGTHKTRSFEKLKVKSVFELRELADLYNLDLTKI
jgi:two-component system invasion response regulator UvrY